MLLDASGSPIAQRPPHPLDATPAPNAPVQAPPNPLAHYANPKLAKGLRDLADLVEHGSVFAVAVVALGLDEERPKALTLVHEHASHRPQMLAELGIVTALVTRGVVDARYFPKPMLADGTPISPEGPGAAA